MAAPFYIIGCGGHARSVADILLAVNPTASVIFVDKKAQPNECIFGFPVVTSHVFNTHDPVFIALGNNKERMLFASEYPDLSYHTIIAPGTHLGKEHTLAKGIFIANQVHLGPNAMIGEHTIINTAAIIEHEVKIGSYCHIGPNATVSGRSTIGDHVFVGVGATVIDKISICSDVIIGAGSTVIRDITEPGTYVGSPAKKINK